MASLGDEMVKIFYGDVKWREKKMKYPFKKSDMEKRGLGLDEAKEER